MYTLEAKVAESLSRLFSGSPNHSSPSDPSQFPAFWWSKWNDHGSQLNTTQSHPVRWKCRTLELQDESLENLQKAHEVEKVSKHNDNKRTLNPRCKNKDSTSERCSSDSDEYRDAQVQRSPVKPPLNLSDESVFITPDLYESLVSSLPNIVEGCQWMLLYSTLKHGISLRTLIRKSDELPGPCLVITGDRKGAVFGAMLECPLKPTPKRKYQGEHQTFVFTTIYGEPMLFRPTVANRYYYICLNDLLAVGGGSSFALCLDADLLSGSRGLCETFGNLCLAHDQDFELNNVELWGFIHGSPYVNRKPLKESSHTNTSFAWF
ncbi:oxidation resistance protein 1-like [Hibiscus syriacus]|uniref:oxidation resistance protein 1-like n=1 Tax=Hibiscus syriacus TaxID=106335 RepID=UPI00192242FF|nr:oxidation resistance protein 1-like [Hibiscus syriacus]